MRVHYNGVAYDLVPATTLKIFLQSRGVAVECPYGLAVACNGVVVPHACWEERLLQPGDQVECLYAIQGG